MITSWAVPDKVEDLYPNKAVELEKSRRILIDQFLKKKFELINPSMIEYADNITFSGKSLSEDTFKVSDPLSGRMLGITPDLTIQTARIDNYLAKTASEVKKYCYCGSVLKAKKEQFTQSREELQIGVEIYGNDKIDADIDVVNTLINSFKLLKIKDILFSFNDIFFYLELLNQLKLSALDSPELRVMFAKKDFISISNTLKGFASNNCLLKIQEYLDIYGDIDSLTKLSQFFPKNKIVRNKITNIKLIQKSLPKNVNFNFDASDVDCYEYHSGLIFSVYSSQYKLPIAKGGRFENLTSIFGKTRPAVGFTFDLRNLLFFK